MTPATLPGLAEQVYRAAAQAAALRAEALDLAHRIQDAHRRAVATRNASRPDPAADLRRRILAHITAHPRPHSQADLLVALGLRDKGAVHRAVEHLAQAGALQRSGRAPGRPTHYWLPEESRHA